ncbi:MAG: M48 family metalloprotease [Candidatus Acidiferrales bacterium]
MSTLPPTFAPLLASIKNALNDALRNEKQNVSEHVTHPPFEFDYIDSATPNAYAVSIGGRSFIGVTLPLVRVLWDTCTRLSESPALIAFLGVPILPDSRDVIHAVMFQTQLAFVVAHEYTHHVHGHQPQSAAAPTPFSEILISNNAGSLESQAFEIDADGYAVYHVLAHLIQGALRSIATDSLGCKEWEEAKQDEVLFSLFVVAIGGFLFVVPPIPLDPSTIYTLSHPPQAARMNWIMYNAIGWCKQNRPALEARMRQDRFQMLMRIAAGATWGMNGGKDWSEQTTFLQSESGSEYMKKLDAKVKEHILSL